MPPLLLLSHYCYTIVAGPNCLWKCYSGCCCRVVAVLKLSVKMPPMLLLHIKTYCCYRRDIAVKYCWPHAIAPDGVEDADCYSRNNWCCPLSCLWKCHLCCCYRAVTTSKLTANMPCMLPIHILIHCRCLLLLLPSCNDVEVDCGYAMHAADTHNNTLLLPTDISLLLYRYC